MRLAFLALMLPTTAAAGPIVTDTFSGTADDSSGERSYKLNTYEVSAPVRLVDVAVYLQPEEANVDVEFVVYERTGSDWFGNDEWDLVWNSGIVALSQGLGFKTSPSISIDLAPGATYAIGVYLDDGDVRYYWDDPGDEVVAWGVREGSLWSNNGGVWSLPGSITSDPSSHGYHQEITVEIYDDLDGDGAHEGRDCDDADPLVFPGAAEMCNGADDDCDGAVDDNVVYVDWFADTDGDGFGDPGDVQNTCDGPPAGYVGAGGDCDDAVDTVFPGATEVCDGVDQDCDATPDDGLPTTNWFPDGDGDGWGAMAQPLTTCDTSPPAGYAAEPRDCDDEVAVVYPDAPELCDGLDNDCAGGPEADEVDSDTDGALDCEDCAPDDAETFPGAEDPCNGVDNDCDGYAPVEADCDPFVGEKIVAGCACRTAPPPPVGLLGLLGLLLLRRRR